MTSKRRSPRAIAAVLVAAAALVLAACTQGEISEERMREIRQPLSDIFRETVIGLGSEGWDEDDFLTRTSWCSHLDQGAEVVDRHRFVDQFRIDNETLNGAEIEAIATRIFEDNGLEAETVVQQDAVDDDGSAFTKTTVTGRLHDDPNAEIVGVVEVWYWGDPAVVGPDVTVSAATACARGEEIIDIEDDQ